MTDTDIKLENCSSNIDLLKKKLEEEIAKKEKLKKISESEKSSSLNDKIRILNDKMNWMQACCYKEKIKAQINWANTNGFKIKNPISIRSWRNGKFIDDLLTYTIDDYSEFWLKYSELIDNDDIKAANEHCGIPEDVYIDPHYPEETVDIKRLRQHIWLSRTPAIFNYEKDKEIFESLKIISLRLDKIEELLGI